jgi:hypothetical protein
MRQELRMPKAEQDPGSQSCLPIIIGGDGIVYEVEQPRWVVLHLDVDVELYVAVFRLNGSYEF